MLRRPDVRGLLAPGPRRVGGSRAVRSVNAMKHLLADARQTIESWYKHYNRERPHSALQ